MAGAGSCIDPLKVREAFSFLKSVGFTACPSAAREMKRPEEIPRRSMITFCIDPLPFMSKSMGKAVKAAGKGLSMFLSAGMKAYMSLHAMEPEAFISPEGAPCCMDISAKGREAVALRDEAGVESEKSDRDSPVESMATRPEARVMCSPERSDAFRELTGSRRDDWRL